MNVRRTQVSESAAAAKGLPHASIGDEGGNPYALFALRPASGSLPDPALGATPPRKSLAARRSALLPSRRPADPGADAQSQGSPSPDGRGPLTHAWPVSS